MVKDQWRRRAPKGVSWVCSDGAIQLCFKRKWRCLCANDFSFLWMWESSRPRDRFLLWPKNLANGRTPSLDISCLTRSFVSMMDYVGAGCEESRSGFHREKYSPRAATNVITMMFPKLDIAIKADSIRVGSVFPEPTWLSVALKNSLATPSMLVSWICFGTTIIYRKISKALHLESKHSHKRG